MPGTPQEPWLLNPGPCSTTSSVRAALSTIDICHREPEYLDIQTEVREQLLEVFDLDPAEWTVALITGSGTAALEMAISSSVSASGKMLVIENGVYGERIHAMGQAHDIETVTVTGDWTSPPDLEALERTLAAHPDIEVVAGVHHETTTGLLNPVAEISRRVRAAGKRFVLDTISGLGGESLNIEDVDIAVCTANKLLQGLPGVSFCFVRRDFAKDLAGYPARTLYLNLANYLAKQEGGGTPFTPAVQVTYAMRQALLELKEETVDGRVARMAAVAGKLREGFKRLGLEFYIDPALHSNTITSLRLPQGMTYETLHDRMREHGYVIYAGQGDLRKTVFRIANMGALTDEAVAGVITALEEAIR